MGKCREKITKNERSVKLLYESFDMYSLVVIRWVRLLRFYFKFLYLWM